MVSRTKFENSAEIGAYATITNSFCLLPNQPPSSFFSAIESLFPPSFPIVCSNIGGTAIVGRLTVGNKHGLLVPITTTDDELLILRSRLPELQIERIRESFSALGNVISCNDHVALVHPELDRDTLDSIQDVLNVEPIASNIAGETLVGSYSTFTNRGGVVPPSTSQEQIHELSEQIGVPLEAATVNKGSSLISAGVCVNDNYLLCGWETTALEIAQLTRIFKVDDRSNDQDNLINFDESVLDLIL